MEKKQKNGKTKKIDLLSLLALLCLGVAVILVVNATYHYDPTGSAEMPGEGEKGVLLLDYNGADGKAESEELHYSKYEKITLPTLTKKGYHFSGWEMGNTFVGTQIAPAAKKTEVKARFDKDYTAIQSPLCRVYR